jgi:Cu(I)/Ag(I) efflux system protein CusF
MKRLVLTSAVLALAVAACDKKQAAEPVAPAATSAQSPMANTVPAARPDMSKMDMSAGAKMGKGSGTVEAVDASAGTITLNHGPIPEANWPAMTMTFKAAPAVTGAVKPGDKVNFDVKLENGSDEVTAIHKQ